MIGKIHQFKPIKIRPVFMCSPLTFFLFLLSENSIHNQSYNNPSGLRQSNHSCTRLNYSTTNGDIRILNPLGNTLSDLFHTEWLNRVPVRPPWLVYPVDLPQFFDLLHYDNQINKRLVFLSALLTKSLIFLQCDWILCLWRLWIRR